MNKEAMKAIRRHVSANLQDSTGPLARRTLRQLKRDYQRVPWNKRASLKAALMEAVA